MKKCFSLMLIITLLSSCGVSSKVGKSPEVNSKPETIAFMGIPIDGSKRAFVQELKKKGFRYDLTGKVLEGQFNGKNVKLVVSTNKNIVDRVFVMFPSNRPNAIKNEYNILLDQFGKNEKYAEMVANPIPDDEDIDYEISSNGKRYEAVYYARLSDMNAFNDAAARAFAGLDESHAMTPDERWSKLLSELKLGTVWFTILPYTIGYGQYYIGLYYDNDKNRPHGEDL